MRENYKSTECMLIDMIMLYQLHFIISSRHDEDTVMFLLHHLIKDIQLAKKDDNT